MQDFSQTDLTYLRRCLDLAAKGKGYVKLNPMVGCVIVHEDRIIGEEYHQKYGGPHAEVNAINSVENQALLKDSTLYVSLEPCCIHAKTPPCANLIVEKGIPKVVIGILDPNPKVFKNGVRHLEQNGVEVIHGALESEGRQLNKVFFKNQRSRLPYITLKWAETADGFMGTVGKRVQISNHLTNKLSHKMRKEHDAILVGHNTVLTDDPELTDRVFGNSPIRIVLDNQLTLADHLKVFNQTDESYTIVVNNLKEDLSDLNVKYLQVSRDENFLANLLKRLYALEIGNVIVEGGKKILQYFIDNNQWDEAIIFQSNDQLLEGISSPQIRGISKETTLGNNKVIQLIPAKGKA